MSLRSVFHFGIDSTGFRGNLKSINKIRNEKGDITSETEEIEKKSSNPTTKGYPQQNWKI